MEEIEVKTQIKEIIRKGEYHPYKSKYYYQTNNQLFPRVPDYLKPYYNFWVRSINSQTSLDPKAEPFHPKFKTELNANSSRWYPKELRLSINASKYIPKKNRCKDKVTALTVYKPNVIDVKEQTGTSISNNIYAPTGLIYNLVNIIWQTLHKDILTSEPHLKAPMRSDFSKLPSIQIWNNEDISTRSLTNKLENANRHHSIVQIVPIAIMSGKYETGTSKVYYQICIDPTSRSFNLFFLIASLTDKNIFTLSRKVSRIMYDSEKSFTSLSDTISDTILKLPATSNVNEDYANTGNVMNVSKNLLTHKNKKRISKDGFQLYVSPIIRFFNSPSRNITNIQLDTSDINLNINAQDIPTKNRRKDKVTALTVYKPNVIDVKEQTGTSISNNIYAPTGLMYNLVNIIWQTLHKDILTPEAHLKASMGLNVGKLPSIQIWSNEDISTKLENANRHHSIEQIIPIAIMSGKYKFGTSKVYFQICIDPTSRSFNLFSLIVSLTDKSIFTLSGYTVSIMYDSEKSFTSLSDKILKLPATSNVSEYDAKNGNVMNVIKNSLTHENERVISNQIAIDKVKDDFQRYVSPMRRFFNFPSRNIKNIHSNIIGIKRTKKTILRLSNNNEDKIKVNTGENKIEAKIDEKQFKGEASHNEISQTNTSGNYEQTIKYALEKSNENDTKAKGIEIKMSDSVNKKDNIDNNLNINEIINEEKSKQKKRMDDNKSKEKENDIEIKKEEKEIMNKSNLKFNMDPNSDENSLFHKISTVTTEEAKTKIPNQQKEQTKNFLIINGKSFFRGEELKETKKRKEEMPYSEVNNINRNNEESSGCFLF